MSKRSLNIIISGGGTGGHIFPALAIANALNAVSKEINILFVGAKGKMEMEKVPAAGYPIEGLWISGINRRQMAKNLTFPFKLIFSIYKAGRIIKKSRPDIVIGVGGYASGPTLRVASRRKIPTLIQEQNSYPGITNKLLAKDVSRICVAYDGMDKYFPEEKIIKTGNPIRKEVIEIEGKREESYEYFGFDKRKLNIFVVGGSQGALSINRVISSILDLFKENNFNLLWQTGKQYAQEAEAFKLNAEYEGIKVVEFINRMDLAYAYADIVISRAGAIAISELCAVGKPVIFIPLPSAAEDHQMKNANALEKLNAAMVIPDSEAQNRLGDALLKLAGDEDLRNTMKENISRLAITDAAERIIHEILKLIDD
jgi:UDP-N-acetylglucosamine--N-acetylmuramyl-(pentapeptide) pyrophosphoryl-undecaprenol N-acetylglucosamine transferase